MQKFIGVSLPEGASWITYFEKAKAQYLSHSFIGTETTIVNKLTGGALVHITTTSLYKEAALHSPEKTSERLNRWQHFSIDTPPCQKRSSCQKDQQNSEIEEYSDELSLFKSNDTKYSDAYIFPTRAYTTPPCANIVNVLGEEIPYFALVEGSPWHGLTTRLLSFLPTILADQFSILGKPPSQASENEIENILTVCPIQLQQRSEKAYKILPEKCDLSLSLTIVLAIKSALWAVNIGANRVLLLQKDQTLQLTDDALSTNERFRKKIEKRGGRIPSDQPILARAFADSSIPWISPRPEVTRYSYASESITLIIGSPVIFERFTSREVADEYRKQGNPKALVQNALSTGSKENAQAIVAEISG